MTTGLIYMWNRWQDPETGRFISEDPARDGNNWYAYVGNNPINFTDPTGLMRAEEYARTFAKQAGYEIVNKGNGYSSEKDKTGGSPPPQPPKIDPPIVKWFKDFTNGWGQGSKAASDALGDKYKNFNVAEEFDKLAKLYKELDEHPDKWAAEKVDELKGLLNDFNNGTAGEKGKILAAMLIATVGDPLSKLEKGGLRNAKLAGDLHPKTGVPFTKEGFPDFTKHLYDRGKNDVQIKPTGDRPKDYIAANEAAGYSSTPRGYTWHHHEDNGRMQLVDTEIHSQTGHTGGFSLW